MDSAADSNTDGGQDKPNKEEKSKRVVVKRPQIIHKSSKELYKAVAAQWGITCKMSDHCRCLDCQVIIHLPYLHSYAIHLVKTSGSFITSTAPSFQKVWGVWNTLQGSGGPG